MTTTGAETPLEVEKFRACADAFCSWAEGGSGGSDEGLYLAMRHVADVYASLLSMPSADPDPAASEHFVDKNDHHAVYDHFRLLPLQYYGEVFDTTVVPPGDPTVGDLADDLLDIYTDLKTGLLHYSDGNIPHAVWHWKWTWAVHWGRHATSALRAMHCFMTTMDRGAA